MGASAEALLAFGVFFGLLLGGLWVPFSITAAAVFYLLLHIGWAGLAGLGTASWGSTNSFTLTAIPLFIMLAQILEKSGLSVRIYRGMAAFVRWIPGGLLQTNVVGCALFAAISGSSVATAATIGSVALPQLLGRNYDRKLSVGSLAAGGTLGIMFPPSIALIIYGTFTQTSVVKLFMAGVMPGLLMAGLFMVCIAVQTILRPSMVPRESTASPSHLLMAVADLVPFVLLIGTTLGSIYAGIATPTEAASLGCVFAVLISCLWGDFGWRQFCRAMVDTVAVCGNIMFIVYSALLFSYAIALGGAGVDVTHYIASMHLTRIEFVLVLFILYTILGCMLESIGMIVITVPLIFPVLMHYGIDPIWFGILLVLFVEIGQITPPIGINLFVIQGIWTGRLSEVIYGTIPFHIVMLAMIAILVLWPGLALWLPSSMPHHIQAASLVHSVG